MNNFTKNGNGASVEINAFFDSGMSQYYFDDNFERLDDSVFFYTDWQNIEKVELEDMYIVTNDTRENVIKELSETCCDWDENNDPKMSNEELKKVLDSNLDYDYNETDFFEFDSENFAEIETRGYSQGDYAKVYVDLRAMRKMTGKEDFNADTLKDTIHNLFWNSPLYVKVIVDGQEYLNSDSCGEYCTIEDTREEMLKNMKNELTDEQYSGVETVFAQVEPKYN